ncbi:MAG: transglutaminase domain-containing protein [Lentimonas sp.]
MIRATALKELNFILHEAPAEDGDWGWFCREHAAVIHAVSRMLGLNSTVVEGLLIMQDGTNTLATIPFGHAWNVIDGARHFDASITTYHMTTQFKEFTCVDTKHPERCPYSITICNKLPSTIKDPNRPDGLSYYRKEVFDFEPIDLMENPYQFIHPPEGVTPDLLISFGRDIFFKLAYHIYLVHQEQAKPLHKSHKSEDALEAVENARKGARKKVVELLTK